MPLVRGTHSFDSHFTQIPNAWLRDARLSYKARGILAELLSHSPGFSVSRDRMARLGKEGRDSISAGIAELEKYGYLKRQQTRNANGTMGETVWTTQDPETQQNTRSEPWTDYPSAAEPSAANPHPKNTEIKNNNSKNNSPATAAAVVGAFAEFWEVYPRKVGKGSALKAYRLAAAEHGEQVILEGAKRLAADPNLPYERRFIPHAATWLNRMGWEDEPYPHRERTKEELEAIARDRAAKERAEREERRKREAEEREREAASFVPAPRCIHDRIVYNCPKCGPGALAALEGDTPNAT